METVLVTGATGFVGRRVIQELLNQPIHIIATARNEHKISQMPWYDKIEFIPYDFNKPIKDCYTHFHQPNRVIHTAWQGLPNYQSKHHLEKNLPGQLRFLNGLIVSGLKDLTVTGTCLEYGLKEGKLSEEMQVSPNTVYALAKQSLYRSLHHLRKQHDFDLKWLRLFYLFGEGQSEHALLPQLQRAIGRGQTSFNMSPGDQLRDYLDIDTCAELIVKLAFQNKIDDIINCCSGKPTQLRDLINNYLADQRSTIRINYGYYEYAKHEPHSFWGDTKKLQMGIES